VSEPKGERGARVQQSAKGRTGSTRCGSRGQTRQSETETESGALDGRSGERAQPSNTRDGQQHHRSDLSVDCRVKRRGKGC
jgi:hypothetical protein